MEIMLCVSMILVTGANKGLGRETARRLIAEGHDVWAAARDPERGQAVAEELGARPLVLDVTDDASVDTAAKTVAHATGGVNSVDPGFTVTDLNAHRGTQTVTEGTDAIVRMATIGPEGPTGSFVSRDGPVPW
jgi:uncharacterized protein YbjT (DUF2867 family)